ncbi:MAG: LPS export ABC transporter periplasmic protein LptC [Chloroflexaceae bacterium]|nr:LPS export ABC transporter periplasmic protein LptC [Chloroflexaceae bacterium]
MVLRGQEAQWQPETNLLTLRDRPTGSHKKLQVVAKESHYNSRTQVVELAGQIVVTLKSPSLQLKSEHVFWELKTDKIISDRPTQLVQFEPKNNTVSEQVTAQRVEVDLEQDTAHFQQQVNLISVKPAVEIAGSSLTWQYNNRLIVADKPVQLFHPQEQLTVTGNRGQLDLKREVATLEGGVKGLNQRNQSQLYADRLTWQIPTQILEAEGHVTYAQSDPPANLKGTKATGTLRDNRVVVYGGADRVETQIFPDS